MSGPVRCARCDQVHTRCAAHNRKGGPCGRPAQAGGVCRYHGGEAPQTLAKEVRRQALGEAVAELTRLGRPLEVDPGDALLEMVYEAAGNVAWLRAQVQALDVVYGRVRDDQPKAEPHVLVGMYDAERDRLAHYSALALRAGVELRRVELAETEARRLYSAVAAAMIAARIVGTAQEAFRIALANELRRTGAVEAGLAR